MPKGLGSRRLGVRIEVAMLVFTQFGYWVKSGMTVSPSSRFPPTRE